MTTTNVLSTNQAQQQLSLNSTYDSLVLEILKNKGMNREEKLEALRNLEAIPSQIDEIRNIYYEYKGSEIYDPKVIERFLAPFSEGGQASLLKVILSTNSLREEDFFLEIYQVFKEKMPLKMWCREFFRYGKFDANLFLEDLNDETAAQFSFKDFTHDTYYYGKEFVSKLYLLCPLTDVPKDFYEFEELLRYLYEMDLREVFERFLRANLIDTEKLVEQRLFFPERWHEESSFREAWRISNEKKILTFLEEAKKREEKGNTISALEFQKPIAWALLTGRLDLAEEILACRNIFIRLPLLKRCVALGEIASVDWACQKGLTQTVKSRLGSCVTELFARVVSPASCKALNELLDKDYFEYKSHKIEILTSLIQSENFGYMEMLFDWREVTTEEWDQVFQRSQSHTSALFKHIFAEVTHQEIEEFFQKIPDEHLEKMFLERDFFKDMDGKLITLFAAKYLKYDFNQALKFIVEWKTKMSKSALFKWNSTNMTSLLLGFKHHPECEYLRAMGQTGEWTPEMLLSWAAEIENHWVSNSKWINSPSICQNLLIEFSSAALPLVKTMSDILLGLSRDVQKKIFTSPSVLGYIIKDLSLVIDLLGSESFELELFGTRFPQGWLKEPEFLKAARNNQLPQIQKALERDLTPQEASQWIGMALIRGHLDLAKKLALKNPETEPLPLEVLKFCLVFEQYESLRFIEIYQLVPRIVDKESAIGANLLFNRILSLPDQTEKLRFFRLFSQSGMNFQPYIIKRLKQACEDDDLKEALFFLELGALHVDHYGSGQAGDHSESESSLGILEEASTRLLRHIFTQAPQTWFQFLLQNPKVSLAVEHDRALQIALEVRLKLHPEKAIQFMNEVDREIKDIDEKDLVRNAFYRALFLSPKHPKIYKRLLTILKFFHQEKAPILQEIFFHIFTKFRPEILSSDSKIITLLACWNSIQNEEERALFFNGLQVQHPIEKIRDAILGRRYFHGSEARKDERAILQSLAYIEVATYQKGKAFALEIYREKKDQPEMQLAAIRVLSSLAAPLPEDVVSEMEGRCAAQETPLNMKEALLQLFWALSRDPDDVKLKELFLRHPEAAFDLIGYLNYTSEEMEEVIPHLLELSHSEDKKMRVRAAFTLSRLPHEKALLRALEIVQSSDWDAYDEDFRFEEKRHGGHWLMFLKKPSFQDSRSSMVKRILDRFAEANRSQLREVVAEKMEAFEADSKAFPLLKALFDLVMKPPSSSRYFHSPIYYPKGAIFRGLCGRKGESRFYESIRDLLRHGSYRSDLSHFGLDYNYGTWAKVGHIFGSHSKEGISIYNESHDLAGATIAFESNYYNHEYMKGFARHEEESSLNTLLYRGIPWAAIRRVKISQSLQEPLEALWQNLELPDSMLFEGLGREEIEELRENLTRVYDKLTFEDDIDEEEISLERIAKKTVKRHIQREAARKLYHREVAMQDEILEDFSDEEYATYIPRMIDLFKPGVINQISPDTRGLPPRLRAVTRLVSLFKGGDLSKLEEKQALHGLSYSGIQLVKALTEGVDYKTALMEHQYLPCNEGEYQEIRRKFYDNSNK